ncbi:TPA: transposase [Enterobacter kobei]|uniref:integrase core domain-containing protein n=1 Tax=Enterobacter kobei TaxID=208224 RepID=UPI003D6822C3|nr:transposase [Enterobacter kobei]HDC4552108.1 transposase [Enterobacter kobei]
MKSGSRIHFLRQGTATYNATVESFNGRLRQECLNENYFMASGGCTLQNRGLADIV